MTPDFVPTYWNDERDHRRILAEAINAPRNGTLRMFRTAPNVFRALRPDNSRISFASSTTGGVQEAINEMDEHGFDLEIYGGGISSAGVDTSVINLSTPLAFPRCSLSRFVSRQ